MRNLYTLLIFSLALSATTAQDNNYWFQTFGAPASALGGNVIAGVRDNSAAFYNPGALGFIKDPDISVSGNVYGYRYFDLENGLGEGTDVFTGGYLLYPQMLSSVFRVGKENPWHINFNWLTRNHAFKIMNERYEQDYDVISVLEGDKRYVGSLDYFQDLSEQWVGLGAGRPLNEYWSVGFSVFGTYRWQLNRLESSLETYPQDNFVELPDGTVTPWYVASQGALQRVQFENFLPIDAYIVVDAVGDSNIVNPPDSFLGLEEENYSDVVEEHRQVLNVGVAYEYNWDSSYDPKLDKRLEGIEESLSKAFVYQATLIVGYTVVFN